MIDPQNQASRERHLHSLSFQREMYCPQASPTQPIKDHSICLPPLPPQPLYEWFCYPLTPKLEAQRHLHPSLIHPETNHYQLLCNQSSSPAAHVQSLDLIWIPPKIFLKRFPVSILPLSGSLHATVGLVFLNCKYQRVTSQVKISQWLPIAYEICPLSCLVSSFST